MTGTAKPRWALTVLFLAMPVAYSCWRWIRGTSDAHRRVGLAADTQVDAGIRAGLQCHFLHPGALPGAAESTHSRPGTDACSTTTTIGADIIRSRICCREPGALATVIAGAVFSAWLIRRTPKGDVTRLLLFWLALLGFLSALPQVVIGTVILQNDVGRAMSYPAFLAGRPAAGFDRRVLRHGSCVVWRLTPYLLSVTGEEDAPRARHGGISYRRTALHSRHSADRRVPDSKRGDRGIAAAVRGRRR